MTYIVEITEIATGITRSYQEPEDWLREDGGDRQFLWEEGNYSCDCNRRLFFARAAGEPEDWESGCSDDKYRVTIRDTEGGLLYSEAPPILVFVGGALPDFMLWSRSAPPTATDWLMSQLGKESGWTG